jgi:hypothetical protein
MTVKQIQEWLCLHGFHIKIDNKYGPATESACIDFCQKHGLKFLGKDDTTFQLKLIEPIEKANKKVLASNIRDALIKVAENHLAQKPREVGGPNCGPWVRLYFNGKEGKAYPWCAIFATYCLEQTKKQGFTSWLGLDGSSSSIYKKAKKLGKVLDKPEAGCLFLVKNTKGIPPFKSHVHTGIVVSVGNGYINTIEGNTNVGGSVNGDGVYARRRALKNLDFIKID